MEFIEVITALLREYALCDSCLGRQFAMLGYGLTNEERGRALKLACTIEGSRVAKEENEKGMEILRSLATNGFSETAAKTLEAAGIAVEKPGVTCYLCGGTFLRIGELAEAAAKALLKYEYDTFLVGIKTDADVEDREDELRSKFGIRWGESLRNEYSREIGKRILVETGRAVDLKRPDILIIADPFRGKVRLDVNSLFVSGRYRKLVRGIPQSKWLCSECGGKGCEKCGGTGRLYPDSIEELVVAPLLEVTGGTEAKLHASGREDIDVRTLGSGRPFVAEVKRPRLRNIDLEKLREAINRDSKGKIEVSELKLSSKEMVRNIKGAEKSVKVYRAIVEFAKELSDEDMLKIEDLGNRLISQQTPLRVAHRRAAKTRKRYLYEIELKKLKSNQVEMQIRCQGGLYVKELINGDEGRTQPSVSEAVGAPAKCIELDVLKVELEAQ